MSSGDWNVICDRTGFKVKASQCMRTWDGKIVRRKSWEPRQPQDFVRGRKDKQTVPFSRPFTDPVYITASDITADDL